MSHLLELFVSGDSIRSRAARTKLERICEAQMPGEYELVVIDVEAEPERAAASGVDVTPTVIRRKPPPEVRIVGDIADEAAILAALDLDRC